SSDMIAAARRNAEEAGGTIDFKTAGLAEIDRVFSPGFDVVNCMGNSLPHLKSKESLLKAFSSVAGVLKPGGFFLLQVRNYHRVYARNERFMPLNSRAEGDREYLYLRMIDLGEEFLNFNIVVLSKNEAGKWSYRVESEKLKPWKFSDIEPCLQKNGFAVSGVFGDFGFGPFEPLESTDLIVIARKNG
ncbi:MAG: methyltransferase domain-containing protein, partial [Eubacteriales bacterium]